jgi:hypothetical protein
LTSGIIEGTVRTADGSGLAAPILITGGAGFRVVIRSNPNGEFVIPLPYGRYQLSAERPCGASCSAVALVAPWQTVRIDLVIGGPGPVHDTPLRAAQTSGIWSDTTNGRFYPEAFSLHGVLLSREPSSVTQPLDFAGLSDHRLAIESQRGFSWTDTQYKLQGIDGTDSYQPGLPVVLPDMQAFNEVVVATAFGQVSSSNGGSEVGIFLPEPGASWHGSLSSTDTGAAFSSTNLPPPADRGLVQQAGRFRWFTRDHAEIGGPLNRWADLYTSASGQWSRETEPLAAPGTDQRSRSLFGNVRGRVRAGGGDQFEALYSGSRLDLSGGGLPAGLEALTGNRMAPSFVLPGGFAGEPENDSFDFLQVGWTHVLSAAPGLIQVRYGYSVAHLNTSTAPTGPSRIELLGGTVAGAPPLANTAVRPHQQIEISWQPAMWRRLAGRHQMVGGGGWIRSEPRNRFITLSGLNLITAAGTPAFVVEFNTPLDSRELVQSLSGYLADHVSMAQSLSLDMGIVADFSRGSRPAQRSPAGFFTPVRTFAARPDQIVWNSVSPRAGFAWQVPHSHSLVLRGAYTHLHVPLAGRYLDFGNRNSLGGSVYQWLASNSTEPFQPFQQGNLLLRFGGPYSSISPALRRPGSDEFDVGAEFHLTPKSMGSIHLFRRDNKDRIAPIDIGVPASAFAPTSILDPGPDGIGGTFDDQHLTVYAQNPATFGQDRYLLTNPPGLGMLNAGLLAEARTDWRGLTLHASFVAEKSYGPTNPGNAFYENDPGVIGALFLDPNTAIHATGRTYVDRAYVGKIQASYQIPAAWGGIEIAAVAAYMDGLVFARQLLVTGLPQGPFVVATTVRGSPEGGNRAQYAIDWNLRLSREFALPSGRLAALVDVLNVTNGNQRLQENDLSGTSFNLRLPVALEPPRFVRLGLRYDF